MLYVLQKCLHPNQATFGLIFYDYISIFYPFFDYIVFRLFCQQLVDIISVLMVLYSFLRGLHVL